MPTEPTIFTPPVLPVGMRDRITENVTKAKEILASKHAPATPPA